MKQKYSSYKLLALSSALSALSLTAAAQNANVVYQDSNVRFTLVTDGTVRMEYAPDGKFLDKGRKYDCAIYQDAPDADYEKNPSAYVITHRTVKKGDVLKLKQARGGGFAVSLMAK